MILKTLLQNIYFVSANTKMFFFDKFDTITIFLTDMPEY